MSAVSILPSAQKSRQREQPASLVERMHPWLLDSQQDLAHLAEVVVAEVGEAQTAEREMRLRYALWLLWQALECVDSVEMLLLCPACEEGASLWSPETRAAHH